MRFSEKAISAPDVSSAEDGKPAKWTGITRRVFFKTAAAPIATVAVMGVSRAARLPGHLSYLERHASGVLGSAMDSADANEFGTNGMLSPVQEPNAGMGIAETSLTNMSGPVSGRSGRPPVWDTYELLEKCHQLGGSGIQAELNGDLKKLRLRAEQLEMWIEGMIPVPRNGDLAAFEQRLLDAKTAGATVVRTALLGGRRYEFFASFEDWKHWVDQSRDAVALAIPLLDRHKVTLAIENHKDWTLDEMQALLKAYESEYLGCCFDFGNNIALLDDPMEMAVTLAPYVKATHVKDMAVRPYHDGFLLSEVPLGTGLLDLVGMVSTLKRANPRLRLSLEMITRDPLKVPCMTPQYWTVFPDRNGRYLARTFKLVQEHSASGPLPTVSQLSGDQRVRVEEENIKVCIGYANAHLAH